MRQQNTLSQRKLFPVAFQLWLSAAGMGYRSRGGGLVGLLGRRWRLQEGVATAGHHAPAFR
jgi:hypothetical protein